MRFMIFLCLSASLLLSETNTTLEIAGRIALKGAAPHTYLVIEERGSGTLYAIENAECFGLFDKQNRRVKLKAKILTKSKGPGFPARIEVLSCNDLLTDKSCKE